MVARSLFRGGLRLLSRCFRVSKFHYMCSQEVFMRIIILNGVLFAVVDFHQNSQTAVISNRVILYIYRMRMICIRFGHFWSFTDDRR